MWPSPAPRDSGSSRSHSKSLPAKCTRPSCSKTSWNGKEGEYCSRECRDKKAKCTRPSCSKTSWNGKEGEYCSRECRDKKAKCIRLGCFKKSWNGHEGEYCTHECRNKKKENITYGGVWHLCIRQGCTKASWNGQKGEYCTPECRDKKDSKTPSSGRAGSNISSGAPAPAAASLETRDMQTAANQSAPSSGHTGYNMSSGAPAPRAASLETRDMQTAANQSAPSSGRAGSNISSGAPAPAAASLETRDMQTAANLSVRYSCARPDCFQVSWNGQKGEYCTLMCRLATENSDCGMAPSSGHAGNNVSSGAPAPPAASLETRDMQTAANQSVRYSCARPDCFQVSWNGQKGEYCTPECRNLEWPALADLSKAPSKQAPSSGHAGNNVSSGAPAPPAASLETRDMQTAANQSAPSSGHTGYNMSSGAPARAAASHETRDEIAANSFVWHLCIRQGCTKASWNGQKGEYCTPECRLEPENSDCGMAPSSGHTGYNMSSGAPARAAASHETRDPQSSRACPTQDLTLDHSTHASTTSISRSRARSPVSSTPSATQGQPHQGSIAPPMTIKFSGEGPLKDVGLIGFYFPGQNTPVDQRCKATFLGNFYSRNLQIRSNTYFDFGRLHTFQNAEAAFQALKFWQQKERFQNCSAEVAFRRKQYLRGWEDRSYAGHGSNWAAMHHVLEQKFKDPELRGGLMATGNAFLLEHNAVPNRDAIWSNNYDGSGKNWLGLQLMLLRDELRGGKKNWTSWLQQHVNLRTGETKDEEWSKMVMRATKAIHYVVGSRALNSESEAPPRKQNWNKRARSAGGHF